MKKILITGGAGFIGINAAKYFLDKGNEVIALDNLSRRGSDLNLKWLAGKKYKNFSFVKSDIRDYKTLLKIFKKNSGIDVILHLAAQVAVTTSVVNPREDFEINALGTLNVLEAARAFKEPPVLIYSSTNKVYGCMEDVKVIKRKNHWQFASHKKGVAEDYPLDFHSPYGCSKGAADQYVRDYSRIYGFRTVVLRQSCIYGTRQFGIEDQGWVAHFAIQAYFKRPLTIYGDGKQVRDVLFIDDLINAFNLSIKNIKNISGKIFNVGGGVENQMSLLELISLLEKIYCRKIKYSFAGWRPGDQKIFVSDNSLAGKILCWKPKVGKIQGIRLLTDWIKSNEKELSSFYE
ncbi:MAG: NAD-dependent epimerase/dehydratase family protein [Elusimicrobiota bacterium]